MKKFFAGILVATMVLSMVMVPVTKKDVQAATHYNLNTYEPFASRTKEEIVDKYIAATADDPDYNEYYDVEPSIKAPYSGGVLSYKTRKAINSRHNYMRWLVGVKDNIPVSDNYEDLQIGAVVRNFYFGHSVPDEKRPSDMPQDFFNTGAKVPHNILAGGYGPVGAIEGYCQEGYFVYDNTFGTIGHRAFLLSYKTSNFRFGYAGSVQIGDCLESNNTMDLPIASFPSPGYFPLEQYSPMDSAWSFEINSDVFESNYSYNFSDDDLVVKVTNLGTGSSYVCTTANGKLKADYRMYAFAQPDPRTNEYKNNSFKVEISGLKDKDGGAVTAEYTINFFSMNDMKMESFVKRLYNVCLNREPDQAGLNDWVSRLSNRDIYPVDAAYGFVFGNEFKSMNLCDEHYVEYLYQAFMGRQADPAGKANWTGQLARGVTRESVFKGFAFSPEFEKLCESYGLYIGYDKPLPSNGTRPTGPCSVCAANGGAGNGTGTGAGNQRPVDIEKVNGFVTRLYSVCLDRTPDETGLKTWTDLLANGTYTGKKCAYGFIFSDEFINHHYSDEDYVEHLYAAFFGRPSDAEGKKTWLDALSSGKSREYVFEGFVGSQEFDNICKEYGIIRG